MPKPRAVAPNADVRMVERELALAPEIFTFDSRDRRTLDERVQDAIEQETLMVRRKVGAYWSATDDITKGCIQRGLVCRVCQVILQQVINILSYAPENLAPEVADADAIAASIDRYAGWESEALDIYLSGDTEEAGGVAFAIGTTAVSVRETTPRMPMIRDFEGAEDELEQEWVEDSDVD